VSALLAATLDDEVHEVGDVRLDVARHEVSVRGLGYKYDG
jgi:hypothetical protein